MPSTVATKLQKSMPIALGPSRPKSPSPKRLPIKSTSSNLMGYNKRSSSFVSSPLPSPLPSPSSSSLSSSPFMTEAASLPLGVPAFKPIPSKLKPPITVGQVMVQSNTSNVALNNRVLVTVPNHSSTQKYGQTTNLRVNNKLNSINQSINQSVSINYIMYNK